MAENTPAKVTRSAGEREMAEGTFSPLADVYEDESEIVLVADVPGVTSDGVNIEVDRGVLTIEGRAAFDVPPEKYTRTYVGFEPGTYFRAFALSDEIDREKITASVADGVLTVHMPKAPSARTRKIEVKTK